MLLLHPFPQNFAIIRTSQCPAPCHHKRQQNDLNTIEFAPSMSTTVGSGNSTWSLRSDAPYAFQHCYGSMGDLTTSCNSSSNGITSHHHRRLVVPTAELHADANADFCGTYGHVRQLLDLRYHVRYRKQRQWLHDAIIEDSLLEHLHQKTSEHKHNNHAQNDEMLGGSSLWLILLVGVHGAGKHTTIRKLVDTQHLRLASFVCVDTGR